jgi:hypothetical protein
MTEKNIDDAVRVPGRKEILRIAIADIHVVGNRRSCQQENVRAITDSMSVIAAASRSARSREPEND